MAERKTMGTCKRKSRYGHNLVKRRRKGSDNKMRTVCVMTAADRKRANADRKSARKSR